jgi:hypothetical protein
VLDDRRETRTVLRSLRVARRRRHLADVHWTDTVYKTYLTIALAGAAVFYLSPVFGSDDVSSATVREVVERGPAVVGAVVALAVLLGLRSGSRGGPLALEDADVTHVLLAPVDRAVALRAAAFRQARGVLFTGIVPGVVAGTLAALRLPGNSVEWIAVGAAVGLIVALAAWGAALVASGRHLAGSGATAIGWTLVAWSVLDVVFESTTSPATVLGKLAIAPLEWSPVSLVGVVPALLLPVAGLLLVGGTGLEDLERRAKLVGQLRFAATVQDVRTIMVLHRQLAQELPRVRPWWSVSRRGRGRAAWRRDWQGIARWPTTRLARAAGLGLAAGVALVGARRGAPALVVVAGVALYLAALDASEGLAQEIDHPERPAGAPLPWGTLVVRHLLVPACVLAIVELPALAIVVGFGGRVSVLGIAAIVFVPGAIAGAVAAGMALVLGSPPPSTYLGYGFPEIAGFLLAFRIAFPPALMIGAVAPLALGEHAGGNQPGAADVAFTAVLALLAVCGSVVTWLATRRLNFE